MKPMMGGPTTKPISAAVERSGERLGDYGAKADVQKHKPEDGRIEIEPGADDGNMHGPQAEAETKQEEAARDRDACVAHRHLVEEAFVCFQRSPPKRRSPKGGQPDAFCCARAGCPQPSALSQARGIRYSVVGSLRTTRRTALAATLPRRGWRIASANPRIATGWCPSAHGAACR